MIKEDWVECTLGEICIKATKVKRKEMLETAKLKYLDIGSIDNEANKIISHKDFIWKNAPSRAQQIVQVGDVLFSTVRTYLKNIAQVKAKIYDSEICSSGFTVIRGEKNILDSDFIFYLSISEDFIQPLNELQTGSSYPAVRSKDVFSQKINLPPLPIQRAIVTKIEELFSSLDSGIADLKKAQVQLKIYRQAVLKKAFEGELTKEWRENNSYLMEHFLENLKKEKENAIKCKSISKSDYFPSFEEKELTYKTPDNWLSLPWKTITSNTKYAMKRGPFGSALKKAFFVEKGIVVYEQGHAINDDPFRHRYFITQEKFDELKAFKVQAGDMIISCSGVTLGRICLLPENADTGIINQALLKIDLDEQIILKRFFVLLFRSETFQRLIFKKALGTAMPNMVGMKELKEIPIPIPSIQEQHQIVQQIESRLSVCDKVEESIAISLKKAEALRQSILKKAFEGKLLTPAEVEQCKQAPDYEPASVLLEKIKSGSVEK